MMTLVVTLTTLGCDDRVAQISRESADRQAKQNETMAGLQREVAAGSRKLVEEEGAARRQTLQLHQNLQAEQAKLTDGWNSLETERQKIAAGRRSDSWAASLVKVGGATLAGILGLAFAYLTLFGLRRTDDSAADASELLLEQLLIEPDQLTLLASKSELIEHEHGDCPQHRLLPPASQDGQADHDDS